MNRQQILDLYQWSPGICFRHPGKGEVPTAVVGVIHPEAEGDHEVHACAECVIGMEDIRREAIRREGGEYEPGHVGNALG